MLISILPMPPIVTPVHMNNLYATAEEIFRNVPESCKPCRSIRSSKEPYILGAMISEAAPRLYKATHLGPDGRTIFESVFAHESTKDVMLYTKTFVDQRTNVSISLNGLRHFAHLPDNLTSLIDIVKNLWVYDRRFTEMEDIASIVPLFNSLKEVQTGVADLINYAYDFQHHAWLRDQYKSLYREEPYLLEGLLHGVFSQSPFRKQRYSLGGVALQPERFYLYQQMLKSRAAFDAIPVFHSSEINTTLATLIAQLPPKVSINSKLCFVVEGILDLEVSPYIADPYWSIRDRVENELGLLQKKIVESLREVLYRYCDIHLISPFQFLEREHRASSITIEKNIHDEILIIIHDTVRDTNEMLYGYLPALALTTKAVGYCKQE